MVQIIGIDKPQQAWAIFIKDVEGDGEYLFQSAHWSKAIALEMSYCFDGSKVCKIHFTLAHNKPRDRFAGKVAKQK